MARGGLRDILGRYLKRSPGQIRFVYNEKGKPGLREMDEGRVISFNLSHSGEIVIYALTTGRDIGIDLEKTRMLDDLDGLARSNFSAAEQAALRTLPPHLQHQAFFNCWTRKEAYIKALGDGLLYPLDRFEVTLKPSDSARLVKVEGYPAEAGRWHMEALSVCEGYTAALIAEGQDWKFIQWLWQPDSL